MIAAVVIAVVYLSVVDWGGEEIARMKVLPSDTVLVGMLQVEEQLGVAPCRQRLVVGERQLGEEDVWSVCGVLDWSTVQLTIIVEVSCDDLPSLCMVIKATQQGIPNAFAPLELDPVHKCFHTIIDAAHPLLLRSKKVRGPLRYFGVMGLRGLELKVGSGQKGFFEVRCIKGDEEDISIGLGSFEVGLWLKDFCRLGTIGRLGMSYEGIWWMSWGMVLFGHGMGGTDLEIRDRWLPAPRFTTGDVLGLMVDCSEAEAPMLLFFVNGAKMGDMVFAEEVLGKVLFPAFQLRGDSEIKISPNPDLPAGV